MTLFLLGCSFLHLLEINSLYVHTYLQMSKFMSINSKLKSGFAWRPRHSTKELSARNRVETGFLFAINILYDYLWSLITPGITFSLRQNPIAPECWHAFRRQPNCFLTDSDIQVEEFMNFYKNIFRPLITLILKQCPV